MQPQSHRDTEKKLGFGGGRSDAPFFVALGIIGGTYIFLIVAMLGADLAYTSLGAMGGALASEPIWYAIKLRLISCMGTAFLSVMVGVPLGDVLSLGGGVDEGRGQWVLAR